MSGFGLVSRVFDESLTAFRSVLAAKGIHVTDDALGKAFAKLGISSEGVTASIARTEYGHFGVIAEASGCKPAMSPLESIFKMQGVRPDRVGEQIADKLAWMFGFAARQSTRKPGLDAPLRQAIAA